MLRDAARRDRSSTLPGTTPARRNEERPNMNLVSGKTATARAGRLLLPASAMAVAAALAMPAQAQTQEARAAAPQDANVIIVTAQLREQNLQDTPLSITAVTGE